MRQLTDGIEIKPGTRVELKPGANHLIFTRLKSAIKTGADIKATLIFEKAGAIDVEFRIEQLGAAESHDKHKH